MQSQSSPLGRSTCIVKVYLKFLMRIKVRGLQSIYSSQHYWQFSYLILQRLDRNYKTENIHERYFSICGFNVNEYSFPVQLIVNSVCLCENVWSSGNLDSLRHVEPSGPLDCSGPQFWEDLPGVEEQDEWHQKSVAEVVNQDQLQHLEQENILFRQDPDTIFEDEIVQSHHDAEGYSLVQSEEIALSFVHFVRKLFLPPHDSGVENQDDSQGHTLHCRLHFASSLLRP